MDVEKGNAVAFTQWFPFDVKQRPANLVEPAYGNVAGNEWIGNTGKAALLQIDVGAADFRKFDVEQGGIDFQIGNRKLAYFYRRAWSRYDCSKWHE